MNKKLIIIVILAMAFFLRFYKLGSYPSLNADEASIGYNAYSLIETGKDEHGNPWPIHFQSFNDYKPGLYFYIALPFVKYLGLNEWSVRIPNALLGVVTVYLVYLMVKEFYIGSTSTSPGKVRISDCLKLEIIASAMLAISPWHIHFSRGGWEVNTATFFMVSGVYFFLKILKNSRFIYLIVSVLSFILSLYAYHAARIIVPFLGLGLLLIYREYVRKNLRMFLLAGLIGLVALTPLIKDFTRSDTVSRAAGVGIFADPGPLARINEQRGEHANLTGFSARLLHNKLVNYGLAFMENWSEHFHGEFLFLSGDVIQRNKVPEMGQMYLFDIIFIASGIIALFKSENLNKKSKYLIFLWLIVAPIPAALTFQSPHALRSQNMVIPLSIISAFGFVTIFNLILKYKNSILKYLFLCLISTFITWNFVLYQHEYWTHMAKEYPFSSQYGLKELVSYVKDNQDKFNKVVVTNRYDQPYILFLFYLKYPPFLYQNNHILTPRDKYGLSTVENFDKYKFKQIVWDIDQPENPNSIIAGTDEEIPKEANIVSEIYGSNGYIYFNIVAN